MENQKQEAKGFATEAEEYTPPTQPEPQLNWVGYTILGFAAIGFFGTGYFLTMLAEAAIKWMI